MSHVACNLDANPGRDFDETPMCVSEARMQLQNWIAALQTAPRMGGMNDEPEGTRYIQISDTLAQSMVAALNGVLESTR